MQPQYQQGPYAQQQPHPQYQQPQAQPQGAYPQGAYAPQIPGNPPQQWQGQGPPLGGRMGGMPTVRRFVIFFVFLLSRKLNALIPDAEHERRRAGGEWA